MYTNIKIYTNYNFTKIINYLINKKTVKCIFINILFLLWLYIYIYISICLFIHVYYGSEYGCDYSQESFATLLQSLSQRFFQRQAPFGYLRSRDNTWGMRERPLVLRKPRRKPLRSLCESICEKALWIVLRKQLTT